MTAVSTPLVIGLGHRDRGDDAVGPAVAEALAAGGLPGAEVVEHEDPMDLVLRWSGRPWAVVVDAVVSGAAAGTVVTADLRGPAPATRDWGRAALGGTHAFGLAEAIDLSRALGRLPDRVTLVGVEAGDVTPGVGLCPAVASAVPEAVERVRGLLARTRLVPTGAESEHAGGADVPR